MPIALKQTRGRLSRTILRLLLVAAAAGLIYILSTWFFTIETIEVVGANIDLLIEKKLFPKNLVFFPSQKIKEQILRDNPLIKDIAIRKKIPRTLVVVATVRSAVIRLQTGQRTVLVDEEGFVLGDADAGRILPLVQLEVGQVRIGQRVADERLKTALTIVMAMRQISPVATIVASGSASLLAKIAETNIYFPQSGDVTSKVATLQTIFSGFRIKGTLPKVIDLRFDKPIVTF